MKAIVFGATGFIGSHVAEQLALAGHEVLAVLRPTSDTSFLQTLNIQITNIDFENLNEISAVISAGSVVYNCIAYRDRQNDVNRFRQVEIELTKRIAEGAALSRAKRYVQLSSIIVYGSSLPEEPIDETYPPSPELLIDQIALEREEAVRQTASKTGLDYVILQPVSCIGTRARDTLAERLLAAHQQDRFPLIGGGNAKLSLVDVRDVGGAMVWLGETDHGVDQQTYLLKGYDTTWLQVKQELDRIRAKTAGTLKNTHRACNPPGNAHGKTFVNAAAG